MRFDVHYVERTGSTNADLLVLARSGAPPGTVVWTGHQTAGRGRLGRRWEAPAGSSLLASFLLDAESVPFVAVARVALAATDACLDLAGVEAALKWPNDLVIGDRKLAGLLAEADAGSPTLVVGIGCNVAWPPPAERPPELRDQVAALSDHVDVPPDPGALLDALLARLGSWLLVRPEEVLSAYRSRCVTLSHVVKVELAGRSLEGKAIGIGPSGELEVAHQGGTEVVRAGDVVHVRAP